MSWNGVKKQSLKVDIEAWCEKMGIENYTINSKGEIDVYGNVMLQNSLFRELPYKFGIVTGFFDVDTCKNLKSLKNCPDYVRGYFSCDNCYELDSLEGCPQKVGMDFWCRKCKKQFTSEEVRALCKFKECVYL